MQVTWCHEVREYNMLRCAGYVARKNITWRRTLGFMQVTWCHEVREYKMLRWAGYVARKNITWRRTLGFMQVTWCHEVSEYNMLRWAGYVARKNITWRRTLGFMQVTWLANIRCYDGLGMQLGWMLHDEGLCELCRRLRVLNAVKCLRSWWAGYVARLSLSWRGTVWFMQVSWCC